MNRERGLTSRPAACSHSANEMDACMASFEGSTVGLMTRKPSSPVAAHTSCVNFRNPSMPRVDLTTTIATIKTGGSANSVRNARAAAICEARSCRNWRPP